MNRSKLIDRVTTALLAFGFALAGALAAYTWHHRIEPPMRYSTRTYRARTPHGYELRTVRVQRARTQP